MPPPLTVALLGLPGAGKSTLCRKLASQLGWNCFILGDALRSRAATDSTLAERLARGELAPESVAIALIRDAAATLRGQGLILDGFPRHTEQLQLARDLFSPLLGLHLDASAEVVTVRLRKRKTCRLCGWSGSVEDESTVRCPCCRDFGLHGRPEDAPEPLSHRVGEAAERLRELLSHWRHLPLVRIDATRPVEVVVEQAIGVLMSAETATASSLFNLPDA